MDRGVSADIDERRSSLEHPLKGRPGALLAQARRNFLLVLAACAVACLSSLAIHHFWFRFMEARTRTHGVLLKKPQSAPEMRATGHERALSDPGGN